MENKLSIIELSVVDAEKFKRFMQYYDIISMLIDKGIFESKNTAVTLNFDYLGTLQNVTCNTLVYSKRHNLR
jgi:hypothetical protein